MRRNSSELHLEIAEWILEHGDSVSVYDVVKRFDVTFRQATGLLSSIENDGAIETQRGVAIPTQRFHHGVVRTIQVISINHEVISKRKKNPAYHNYKDCLVKSISNLSSAEKWEWIIKNARRRKK
ncbi:hypothetical protein HRW30_005076 [Salmonella enterica]|nr:hypothetical protein [Salmonella enterica]ELD8112319.1 hypothetical protein [Salmonella enterica subsp. enterica serovar Benin]EBC1279724.1 hypothetical protein [Salmonella enterica]EBE7296596.1 hypothetical protein [Salmonella enterica]EFU9296096.1 hypothetical protein [Salmonella enterica]